MKWNPCEPVEDANFSQGAQLESESEERVGQVGVL